MNKFEEEVMNRIKENQGNSSLLKAAQSFMVESTLPKYCYNFSVFGRPIIQYPQDIIAMQEIIWKIKPDLIIETGVAHGGSLIFNASILKLLDLKYPLKYERRVIGVEIDLKLHNKKAIRKHPLSESIDLIEGSSVDKDVFNVVKFRAEKYKRVLVFLDSNHTKNHVLQELLLYSDLVSKNSYIVAFDTIIEELPKGFFKNRNWDKKNSPKSAVDVFLGNNKSFRIDKSVTEKLLISSNKNSFLLKIK